MDTTDGLDDLYDLEDLEPVAIGGGEAATPVVEADFTEEELLDALQGADLLPDLDYHLDDWSPDEDLNLTRGMFEEGGPMEVPQLEDALRDLHIALGQEEEQEERPQEDRTQMALLEEALEALNLEFPPEPDGPLEEEIPVCQPCAPTSTIPNSLPLVTTTNGQFVNLPQQAQPGIESLDALLVALFTKPDGTFSSPEEIESIMAQLENNSIGCEEEELILPFLTHQEEEIEPDPVERCDEEEQSTTFLSPEEIELDPQKFFVGEGETESRSEQLLLSPDEIESLWEQDGPLDPLERTPAEGLSNHEEPVESLSTKEQNVEPDSSSSSSSTQEQLPETAAAASKTNNSQGQEAAENMCSRYRNKKNERRYLESIMAQLESNNIYLEACDEEEQITNFLSPHEDGIEPGMDPATFFTGEGETDSRPEELLLSPEEIESLWEQDVDTEEPLESLSRKEQNVEPDSSSSSTQEQLPETVAAAAENLCSHFRNKKNERRCLGHEGAVYGVAVSDCNRYLASASKDSTVKVWGVADNSLLETLHTAKEAACLRVAWASPRWAMESLERGDGERYSSLLVSAAADGTVKVWASREPGKSTSWACCATFDPPAIRKDWIVQSTTKKESKKGLDFSNLSEVCRPANPEPEDEGEAPQTCAVQWIDHWKGLPTGNRERNSFLLTSSKDFVHIWELEENQEDSMDLRFVEVMSLHFSCLHNNFGYGVAACRVTEKVRGNKLAALENPCLGERTADNIQFVFEIKYCEANGLLGVSLSDGTVRLVNGRGVCTSILQVPRTPISAFVWDSKGDRLATCLAVGHVIVWGINSDMGSTSINCMAILDGGHELGRPVFGAQFLGDGENLLLSWGVDGRICVWDSVARGNIHAPIATLVADEDFPIYSVDAMSVGVVVGGGGESASSLEAPVRIFDTISDIGEAARQRSKNLVNKMRTELALGTQCLPCC